MKPSKPKGELAQDAPTGDAPASKPEDK